MDDIVIKSFATLMEAELGKSVLEAHGIKSFARTKGAWSGLGLPNDNFGADLVVLAKDKEEASKILATDL